MVELSKTFRDDPTRYESLLHKCLAYMNGKLFNGEYFVQEIRWTDLQVPDPTQKNVITAAIRPRKQPYLCRKGLNTSSGKAVSPTGSSAAG